MIETVRIMLALLGALASLETYANAHDFDVTYQTAIHGPTGNCPIAVWTNGEPGAMPFRDYVWTPYSHENPACRDIGHLVQRNVRANNAP